MESLLDNPCQRTNLTSPGLFARPQEGLDEQRPSQTAQAYVRQLARIREHNSAQLDWPLSRLNFDGCDAMLQVWRNRPYRKDGSGPMAIKTCREHGKRLRHFFRCLSRTDKFVWTKPNDFDELKMRLRRSDDEKSALLTTMQVHPFTLDELIVLNQYALPFERLLLLLGLNCGFKRMECATLRVREVQLHTTHPFEKYIAYSFSQDESFVRRLRTKTEVLGDWILWPITVQALSWAMARRKRQTHIAKGDGKGRSISFSPMATVLLNDAGHSFTKPTKKGNSNNQLTNAWSRLLRRIRRDHNDFPWLSHQVLRDTAADLIRQEFSGEIADVFLSHGAPLGSKSLVECYTNKPFGKVFAALRWLEHRLKPVIDATPENPFPDERKKGGGGLTLRQQKRIRKLLEKGVPVGKIAEQIGCSKATIYRHRDQT